MQVLVKKTSVLSAETCTSLAPPTILFLFSWWVPCKKTQGAFCVSTENCHCLWDGFQTTSNNLWWTSCKYLWETFSSSTSMYTLFIYIYIICIYIYSCLHLHNVHVAASKYSSREQAGQQFKVWFIKLMAVTDLMHCCLWSFSAVNFSPFYLSFYTHNAARPTKGTLKKTG